MKHRQVRQQRRSAASIAVSVALNVGLLALIAQAIASTPLLNLFEGPKAPTAPVERISFIAVPKTDGPTQAGISGGDDRPESAKHPLPPLVAPTSIPTSLPPVPAQSAPDDGGGSGPLVGRGGPLAGIRPSFSEPRVWVPPAPIVSAPKTMTERLDSALATRIRLHEDSLQLTASARRAPGDWTWEKNGKKYGWDEKGIRLGDKSIPSALLPKLAANVALNPAAQERQSMERLMDETRAQAVRNINEDQFRKAVKAIRERKERERREAEAAGATAKSQ